MGVKEVPFFFKLQNDTFGKRTYFHLHTYLGSESKVSRINCKNVQSVRTWNGRMEGHIYELYYHRRSENPSLVEFDFVMESEINSDNVSLY